MIEPVEIVKAGLHLEKQKFGKLPQGYQLTFADLRIKVKEDAKTYSVETIGLELMSAQNTALFAIQQMLKETDYRGNLKGRWYCPDTSPKAPVESHLYVVRHKFRPADYLEKYGLKRIRTARGKMEFDGHERDKAMKALHDLANIRHLIVYKRHYKAKNKRGKEERRVDRIEMVAPLIRIMFGWKGLTRQEDKYLDKGRSNNATDEKLYIGIELAPVFVDQVDSYFVPKPANYLDEIKILNKRCSKYVYRFVELLMAEVAQRESRSRGKGNRDWVIKRKFETLAYQLRMNSWIKARCWKSIKGSIKNCCSVAKELKYLKSYKVMLGKMNEQLLELTLNPEKFYQRKKADQQRKQVEVKVLR